MGRGLWPSVPAYLRPASRFRRVVGPEVDALGGRELCVCLQESLRDGNLQATCGLSSTTPARHLRDGCPIGDAQSPGNCGVVGDRIHRCGRESDLDPGVSDGLRDAGGGVLRPPGAHARGTLMSLPCRCRFWPYWDWR
jgi:hypothetical protein